MSRHLRTIILLVLICAPWHTSAAENSEDGDSAPEGPHGGRLLSQDTFALEITIFDTGVPPEMRIYAFEDGAPIDPGLVDVQVRLDRLGVEVDVLSFNSELDYLVGDVVVREPHSFDVSVSASYDGRSSSWRYESHEGRTTVSPRMQAAAGLVIERAGPATLQFSRTLFGVIAPREEALYAVDAPYPGIVEDLHVKPGTVVERGQLLATVRNSATLETYTILSPAAGEVTAIMAKRGGRVDRSPLMEIADLSSVWVELSAFPEDVEALELGQDLAVYDLHGDLLSESEIEYVAPVMTGGHIARARATLSNEQGHWRPGMHVKADIQTGSATVPLAVSREALQEFRDMPVVFARYGDTFEVRMLELGLADQRYVEVIGGIAAGTEYVSRNSFVIKADVLKDGASHDH